MSVATSPDEGSLAAASNASMTVCAIRADQPLHLGNDLALGSFGTERVSRRPAMVSTRMGVIENKV